jgi:hypothetical protein
MQAIAGQFTMFDFKGLHGWPENSQVSMLQPSISGKLFGQMHVVFKGE